MPTAVAKSFDKATKHFETMVHSLMTQSNSLRHLRIDKSPSSQWPFWESALHIPTLVAEASFHVLPFIQRFLQRHPEYPKIIICTTQKWPFDPTDVAKNNTDPNLIANPFLQNLWLNHLLRFFSMRQSVTSTDNKQSFPMSPFFLFSKTI